MDFLLVRTRDEGALFPALRLGFVALCLAAGGLVFGSCGRAWGDGFEATRRANTATIAEIDLEPGSLRVRFEVGERDWGAFADLLPDVDRRRFRRDAIPPPTRVARFFAEVWGVAADGRALEGEVRRVARRFRAPRDEITGDVLDGDVLDHIAPSRRESIYEIVLRYPLTGRPGRITFTPPPGRGENRVAAEIGFLLRHRGLLVSDFAYFTRPETVDLDWDDPWRTRFRSEALRRRFDSRVQLFIVERPREVRVEVVARASDLAARYGIPLGDTIEVEGQTALAASLADRVRGEYTVSIDGTARSDPDHARSAFIQRDLRTIGEIDPPRPLRTIHATLGFVFRYRRPAGAEPSVALTWDLFLPGEDQVAGSLATADADTPVEQTLTPANRTWTWSPSPPPTSTVTRPRPPSGPPETVTVTAQPQEDSRSMTRNSLIVAAVAVGVAGLRRRASRGMRAACGAVTITFLIVAIALPGPEPRVSVTVAEAGVAELLGRTYAALEGWDEVGTYDRLSEAVADDALEAVYLEAVEALAVGKVHLEVDAVELEAFAPSETDANGHVRVVDDRFTAAIEWRVDGRVNHWGHLHRRSVRYRGTATIGTKLGASGNAPTDTWRLAELTAHGVSESSESPR